MVPEPDSIQPTELPPGVAEPPPAPDQDEPEPPPPGAPEPPQHDPSPPEQPEEQDVSFQEQLRRRRVRHDAERQEGGEGGQPEGS